MQYEHIFYLVIWCLVGGMLCSKLLFWITEWKELVRNPGFVLDTIGDGFVVYGGIIGGVLAGWLYCRIKKLNFLAYFDLVIPSVALAQGFGRIGCLLAGCCYGRETDSAFSITFHDSEFAPNNLALVPTQIYSSVLDFLNFAVLLAIAKRKKTDGQVKNRRSGGGVLSDLLQRRTFYPGVFPRGSGPGKRGESFHVAVHQYLYFCGGNYPADAVREKLAK